MTCRHCESTIDQSFLDLGFAPPSNAYLRHEDLSKPECYYPLRLMVCQNCWLVQTEDYPRPDQLFTSDYAYFSSTSTSWLSHASAYSEMITRRLALDAESLVIEVAANDGYLLKHFIQAGIPCLGIEPSVSTAVAAENRGIPVLREFFTSQLASRLAKEGNKADLIIGNNVYAHVPDINDFTMGLEVILKDRGTITLEFPHLMSLLNDSLFDTVYHEHFSYLSLSTLLHIFELAHLRVYDVEELPTHGGSLRVYGCHMNDPRLTSPNVAVLLEKETRHGLGRLETYGRMQKQADKLKDDLLIFLVDQKRMGKRVVGFGAAAKGNTLLNYAGVKPDLLQYVCDSAPSKQGQYLPGSHIPVLGPEVLRERQPDVVLLLPWNIKPELVVQLAYIREWDGKFAVALPSVQVF